MAKVLSSISGNLISAASAGYAPTNGADVSAIASAYQVVSATGTQLYAGTAYVTSLNSAPVSAERAGNAANAALANSAWYDGTGRLISALPDSATVSAIASSYAESSVSGMSGNSSNWNSVYNTVSSNSASWSGGSQALTSPEGTIVVMDNQIEGTNSAVLTTSTGGLDVDMYVDNTALQSYQWTFLTHDHLAEPSATLYMTSQSPMYNTEIVLSGDGYGGGYASASGSMPDGETVIKIPLGNIVGYISASANQYFAIDGWTVKAYKPGTVIVTGVGELAWASSVSGVSATVHNNSANWAASGISSATCSSIASSYAESAASGKQDSGNYISAGGLNQRITGTGSQAVSFASGTNGTNAGLWITGQFSTAYYKDNELKLSRNYHMIAFNIGGQGPKISAMATSKNQSPYLYLFQSGYNSATYSENGFTAVNPDSSILLKYGSAEYDKLTSVHDTVSANSASWGVSGIDSATCSAIASSYAESAVSSKQDSSAMSAYALSADVSGVIDTVSSNSATWGGGGATGDYVEKSSMEVSIGTGNSSTNTAFAQGSYNVADTKSFCQGADNSASLESFAQGLRNSASGRSLAQGILNYAILDSIAQGDSNSAYYTSFAQGQGNTASGNATAFGWYNKAYDGAFVIGKYNLKGNGRWGENPVAFTIGNGTGTATSARHDLLTVSTGGEITVYSSTADTAGFPIVSSIRGVHDTVSANSATWASASAMSAYATTAYVESGLSGKQDVFSAGEGLEFVQSGSDRVLQVEAPVDIVAGPGIVIDNPDGNTLRVSQQYPTDETVLWDGSTTGSDGNITLSESMTNFERIGIFFSIGSAYEQGTYWYGGKWQFFETGDLSITKKFCISDNMNNGDSANTLNFKNQSYTVSNDNLTFTLVRSTQLYYNGSSWAVSTTAKSKIYKVVGIHRTASN